MSIRPGCGPTQRAILECVADGKKRTCREIAEKSGVDEGVASHAVRRLADDDFVRDTGERGGKNGRAVLWRIAPKGRSILDSDAVAAQ
ncbi:winged helix-turn-helix transcriptional regulator [Nocardia thraciensis]